MYLTVGTKVRDALLEQSGGEVRRVINASRLAGDRIIADGEPLYIDVAWPNGIESRYGVDAARERLEVEAPALFDIFKLGVNL